MLIFNKLIKYILKTDNDSNIYEKKSTTYCVNQESIGIVIGYYNKIENINITYYGSYYAYSYYSTLYDDIYHISIQYYNTLNECELYIKEKYQDDELISTEISPNLIKIKPKLPRKKMRA